MSNAVDLATLGLEVKSSGLPEAKSGLVGLEQQAVKTETATARMSAAMASALAAVQNMSVAAIKTAGSERTAAAAADQNAAATVKMAQAQAQAAVEAERHQRQVEKSAQANNALSTSYQTLVGWVQKLAAAFGLYKALDWIKDTAMLSARYDTLGVVMNVVGTNAGYSAKEMAGFQASLEATGIAMIESRSSLAKMAQAHIDLAKSSDLARIAQDAAVIGNINSSEAFSRMVHGIQSAEVEILRNIGLSVSFELAYQKFAKTVGKNSAELTEHEKVQARVNAVMEKGKDIAGTYEASLDTAGKQIQSLKRYVDNLRVSWGAVFQDTLLIATKALTAELKDANEETRALAKADAMKKWGEDMVMTFAAVGDGISGVVKTIQTLTVTTLSGVMQLYYVAVAAKRLATGDLSGAGAAMQQRSNEGEAWRQSMTDIWGSSSYQQDARNMFDKRKADSAADQARAEEAERKKLSAQAASTKLREQEEKQLATEKRFLGSVKDSIAQIKAYESTLRSAAEEKLRFSGTDLTEGLRREAELFGAARNEVSQLINPLLAYNKAVQQVYTEREATEREGLDRITALYVKFTETVRANVENNKAADAGLDMLTEYKALATQMIGVEQDRYRTLLDAERKYAAEITGLMKAKKQELVELQNFFTESNKSFGVKMATALGGSYLLGKNAYLDPNLDAYDRRRANEENLRTRESAASAMSDPKAKLNELRAVYEDWGKMTDAVIVNGAVILTQEDAFKEALSERRRMEQQITEAVEQQQAQLEAAYKASEDRVESYKTKLIELDNILKQMTSTIDLTLKIHGYEQISAIQQFLIDARNNPLIGVAQGQAPQSRGVNSVTYTPVSQPLGSITLAGDINLNMNSPVSQNQSVDIARNILPALQEYQFRML